MLPSSSSIMLCDLPPEIIIQILSKLTPNDLSSCKITNKYLCTIIEESPFLQYCAALILATAEDNPCSDQLVVDKLRALKSSEKAWSLVRPQFTTTVPVTHQQSGVYDLTGGVYLLSNSTRTALYYIKLPSKKEDVVEWKRITLTKIIIDIGLCLFEHDLIVIVTTTPHVDSNSLQTTYDIELEYRQFSTGKPHPGARKSPVLVMNSTWMKPAVGIEIVGDNLVLILSYNNGHRPDDRVYIYDWRNDVLKMSFLAPYRSYSGLLFLTEHLILIPNVRTNALDIFRIPEKPTATTPVPVLVLKLPELAEERLMGGISCRAEPNPIGAASLLAERRGSRKQEGNVVETAPERGFLARAEDAICIFEMRILVLRLNLLQGGWNINFQPRDRFSFIVHRKAFVELVETRGKKDGDSEESLDVERSEGGMDVEPAASEVAEQAEMGSQPAGNAATANVAGPQAEGGQGPNTTQNQQSNSETDAPSIPWAEWGSPITRWFNSDNVSTRWITISAGQRYVRMQDNPPRPGLPFTIIDFNPTNVAKMKRERDKRLKRRFWTHDHDEMDSAAVGTSPFDGVLRMNQQGATESSDFAPEIMETHYEIPGGLGPDETPMVLGSLYHQDVEEFLNQHRESEFQQGSSTSATREVDDDSVSVAATVGSTSRSGLDEEVDEVGDGDRVDDEDVPSTVSLPMLLGQGYHLGRFEGEDDEHEDEDEDDGLSDENYEDAEMDLEEDEDEDEDMEGSDGDTEYGTAEVTGFADDSDNLRDLPMYDPGEDMPMEYERIRVVTSVDQVEPADAFAEPVEGGLPYVACDSQESYVFDGVLLDEERVIGVHTDEDDRIEKVEILYFG